MSEIVQTRLNSFGTALARGYFSRFPVDKGKWKTWMSCRSSLLSNLETVPRPLPPQKTSHGYWMNLDLREEIDRFIYFWGNWEPNETFAIQRRLRSGQTFVDIGANIGYFSLLASNIVGPQGAVYAFEPSPPTATKLRANLALNHAKNVIVREMVVSEAPGTYQISCQHEQNCGMTSLRPAKAALPSWEVPGETVDRIFGQETPIHFIKMDIEGAELLALKGARARLARPDAPEILLEASDQYLKQLGGSAAELFAFVTSFGYKAYGCDRLRLYPLDRLHMAGSEQVSVLFSKQDITARQRVA